MSIIRLLHTPGGIVEEELTQEQIEEFAEIGDEECIAHVCGADNVLQFLRGLTPEQLEQYIINNVTNLAEARQYIIKLSKVVLLLIKCMKLEDL